jgi:hypothetical protein
MVRSILWVGQVVISAAAKSTQVTHPGMEMICDVNTISSCFSSLIKLPLPN